MSLWKEPLHSYRLNAHDITLFPNSIFVVLKNHCFIKYAFSSTQTLLLLKWTAKTRTKLFVFSWKWSLENAPWISWKMWFRGIWLGVRACSIVWHWMFIKLIINRRHKKLHSSQKHTRTLSLHRCLWSFIHEYIFGSRCCSKLVWQV